MSLDINMVLPDTDGLYPPTPYPEKGIRENEIFHSAEVRGLIDIIKRGFFYMGHEFADQMDSNKNYQRIQVILSKLKTEIRDQMRLHRAEYNARNLEREKIRVEKLP